MNSRFGKSFLHGVTERFWSFKDNAFADRDSLFEESKRRGMRPPVFTMEAAAYNVLTHSDLDEHDARAVRGVIPPWKRHRWFRSMKSSQALVQSVFGNLMVMDRIGVLQQVKSCAGQFVFETIGVPRRTLEVEKSINYLGEESGRTTEVDVFAVGEKRIAVECKFCEMDVGRCSRPSLSPLEPHYCNGSYTKQFERQSPCALTEIGIRYWEYIPQIFHWDGNHEMSPCPLHATYQLVLNVLAACVDEQGQISIDNGMAVLLVDARNPTFQPGGRGRIAYDQVKAALRRPNSLQLCTWQEVLKSMRSSNDLTGLTDQIAKKYDL